MSSCQYFGVRTTEREKSKRCLKCKGISPDTFTKCTIETNIFIILGRMSGLKKFRKKVSDQTLCASAIGR